MSVRAADRFLDGNEPLAVVRRNGQTRADPIQILIWHEIVNDVVDGDPLTVTYCPLCNTTLAFDRRFEGRLLDFRTTRRLRHSDMVMYDRQTETWWQQATGEGIVSELAGKQLTFIPAPVMRWSDVKQQLPGDDGAYRDQETGSLWNFAGVATECELVGTQLREVPHGHHFLVRVGGLQAQDQGLGDLAS